LVDIRQRLRLKQPMTMRAAFKNAPRLLVLFLAAVVTARVAIVWVVDSPLASALAWAALLGALSIGALSGKHSAAKALAYLCIVLGADTALQLLSVRVSTAHLLAALSWASLVMGVGIYILRSAQVKRFYAMAPAEGDTSSAA